MNKSLWYMTKRVVFDTFVLFGLLTFLFSGLIPLFRAQIQTVMGM